MIEADHRYLRYALMVAERSRDHGDRPFGAVLVSNRGRILIEAENIENVTHDCLDKNFAVDAAIAQGLGDAIGMTN